MFGSFNRYKSHEKARNNLAMALAESSNIGNNNNLPEEIKNKFDFVEYLNNPDRTADELNSIFEGSFKNPDEKTWYAIAGWAYENMKYGRKNINADKYYNLTTNLTKKASYFKRQKNDKYNPYEMREYKDNGTNMKELIVFNLTLKK